MFVAGFPAGPWAANCYVVAPTDGEQCVIIDPGMDAVDGVARLVSEHDLRPVAVLLTHGHLDHIWSAMQVCGDYDIPAYIHPADRHLLSNPIAGVSGETRRLFNQFARGKIEFVEPEQMHEFAATADEGLPARVQLAGLDFEVDHAPGHTPGTVVIRLPASGENPPLMFSGDFLFAGSIGRTDLPGGDTEQMFASLDWVLSRLDQQTVVLPGHGEATNIGRERATNPFLAQVAAAHGDQHADQRVDEPRDQHRDEHRDQHRDQPRDQHTERLTDETPTGL